MNGALTKDSFNNNGIKIHFWVCLINALLISLSHILNIKFGIYFVCLLIVSQGILAKSEDYLLLILFYMSFSTILKTDINSSSYFTYLEFVLALLYFIKYVKTISTKYLIIVCAMTLLTTIASVISGDVFSTSQISFLLLFAFFPVYYENEKEKLRMKNCALFYIFGVILSFGVSIAFLQFPHLNAFVSDGLNTKTHIYRISGLYSGDANGFASTILVCIGLILALLEKKETNRLFCGILLAVLSVMGFQSVSKSFLVFYILIFFFYMLYLLFSSKVKRKYVIIFCMIVAVVIIINLNIASNVFDYYSTRLTNAKEKNDLTTGRTEIWLSYLQYLIAHPLTLLIGSGLSTKALVTSKLWRAAHNTPIQMVFQVGIIGVIIYFFWLSLLKKSEKKKMFDLMNIIIFLCFFGMWFSLDRFLFDSFFIFTILYEVFVYELRTEDIPETNITQKSKYHYL